MAMSGQVKEIAFLIQEKEKELQQLKEQLEIAKCVDTANAAGDDVTVRREKLTNAEISRYSRQLILPEIGVTGQICVCNSSVLIVGAGGLGCPAAIYLAAAGIGRIGIVDYDEVELSNLHRQILHTEYRVGITKCASVAGACRSLNSHIQCVPHHVQLDSSNALHIIQQYDIVLDATDNVATRYLLNDACVIAGKPLVSGSALRFEGQLTVYNYKGGPCYRCLYPKPPPPETVTNCSDGGVLGVVPGIIGCLQALEAIKIASGNEPSFSQRLLMFDGLDGTFRSVKLRGRQTGCPVCGDNPSIMKLIDYEQFCGARASDKDKGVTLLSKEERISAKEYKSYIDEGKPHVLLDIRQPVEMDICKLPNDAINIPLSSLDKESTLDSILTKVSTISDTSKTLPVICVCRRGNDSQLAVRKLKDKLKTVGVEVKDIAGGLTAWAKQVDPEFPTY